MPSRTVIGCMAASISTLVLFVPVASDAATSSVARAYAEGRDWRGGNGGGNHASVFNHRADAPDACGALRAYEPDRRDPFELARRLAGTPSCTHQLCQHPPSPRAPRFLAVSSRGWLRL